MSRSFTKHDYTNEGVKFHVVNTSRQKTNSAALHKRQILTERGREIDFAPLGAAQEGGCLINLCRHIKRSDAPSHHNDGVDFHVNEVQVDVQLEQGR